MCRFILYTIFCMFMNLLLFLTNGQVYFEHVNEVILDPMIVVKYLLNTKTS